MRREVDERSARWPYRKPIKSLLMGDPIKVFVGMLWRCPRGGEPEGKNAAPAALPSGLAVWRPTVSAGATGAGATGSALFVAFFV